MGNIKSNVGSPSQRSKLFQELVIKSWWVILIFLVSTFAYDQATKRRNREEAKLRTKRDTLVVEKQQALKTQEFLERQIASQDDQGWIELVLKRKLGLVSEGETKVLIVR